MNLLWYFLWQHLLSLCVLFESYIELVYLWFSQGQDRRNTRNTNYMQYWNAFWTTSFFSLVVKISAFLDVSVSSTDIGLGTLFYIMHQFFIALHVLPFHRDVMKIFGEWAFVFSSHNYRYALQQTKLVFFFESLWVFDWCLD